MNLLWLVIFFFLSPVLIPLTLLIIKKTYKVLLVLILLYIGMLIWFQIDNHNRKVASDERDYQTVQIYEDFIAGGGKNSELNHTEIEIINSAYLGLGLLNRQIRPELIYNPSTNTIEEKY
jgi:hypothetical protein